MTCNTDSYGVSYADVLLGSTPTSTVNVTAKADGFSSDFSGGIRLQPTISTGGIADAAAGKLPSLPAPTFPSMAPTSANIPTK